jgi:hypothetical protein
MWSWCCLRDTNSTSMRTQLRVASGGHLKLHRVREFVSGVRRVGTRLDLLGPGVAAGPRQATARRPRFRRGSWPAPSLATAAAAT